MIAAALASLPAQASSKVEACGPPGEQSWLCSVVYDVSDSTRAAELADAVSAPARILVIVLVALLASRLARRAIRRTVRRMQTDEAAERLAKLRRRTGFALLDTGSGPQLSARRVQRAETIGTLLRSVVSVVVWSTAGLMVLEELGVNIGPLLTGAGIVGVALGFGAQSLVRDFLAGFFILIEDQYGVGDVIDTGAPAVGTVEGVSLRTTRLRDVQGVVWHVPNGEIRRVGNKSQQWARALLDIAVAYDTDVPTATRVIKETADAVWRDEQLSPLILGEPEVWGVEELGADRVVIRLVVKTRPLDQWQIARELRLRVKAALDAAGIAPPAPPPPPPAGPAAGGQ